MELLLTFTPDGTAAHDVAVQVDAAHTVDDVATALSHYSGIGANGALWVERPIGWEAVALDRLIGDIDLASGQRVALHRPANAAPGSPPPALRLAVTSGPDAGRSYPLAPGDHLVGRSTECPILLNDPLVSRRQFVLRVGADESVQLFPAPDVRNPVRVDGEDQLDPIDLLTEQVVQAGTTSLCVRRAEASAKRPAADEGRLPFHRTPYFREPLPQAEFDSMGDLPKKPKPRRFQVISALSPVLMGVSMAVLIGSPRYLMFAALSPVVAIGTWFDNRRQGGKDYDEAVEQFGGRLAARIAELKLALRRERIGHLHNNPDLELLARRAGAAHNELWQRDREAEDFLNLRIGVGSGAPALKIKPENNGDDEFIAKVDDAMDRFALMSDIPIAVDLVDQGAIAAAGAPGDVRSFVSALLVQVATLHSPEDVVVYSATAKRNNDLDWLKWLPHTRASSSPIAGRQLATSPEEADSMLRALASVAESRAGSTDQNVDRRWPWLLIVIDRQIEPDASVVSRILDAGPAAGVSVVWLTDTEARVPRQVNALLSYAPVDSGRRSQIRYTNVEMPDQYIDPERIDTAVAAEMARSLAPMRDATAANAVTAIPRVVSLFDSLGVSSISSDWIASQWMTDRGYSLPAPIGRTDSGPLTLDLVEHGPHGLIGGTSGAGKSELVQSLVANLAVCNSPERINFLFVDYKGGALSELFKDIPHTVGAVTNLDALLALRALTSLTAELDRRMEMFKGRASDIKEMIAKFPDEAPPSLVIVVDEFAALVRELPEFVDGIVSIAERGRSLGIHLLMSTQRPSGAINENIQQNTNLRIALRMLDSSESNNVIGAPDAAMIPGPLKGRGLARLGPGELIAFQSAWSGAPLLSDIGLPPVSVTPFAADPEDGVVNAAAPKPTSTDPSRTQLEVTIAAIIEAADQLALSRGRPPWREALPPLISLTDLLDDPRAVGPDASPNAVTVAMIDDPAAQDQYPGSLDFVEGGAIAIFGNGGSGKSTLLKTIAVSAATRDSQRGGGGLTIMAFDFASRALGLLARLPQTAAVVSGDDMEGVTRLLATLQDQVDQRRAALADASSNGETLPEFSRILVLIDGYENMIGQFESTLTGRESQRWIDATNQLLMEGRQFGIHAAFTAGRRGAVRSNVMSALSNRVVLRQADDSAYLDLGVPSKMARGLELAPGQGFVGRNLAVQFAAVGEIDPESGTLDDRDAILDIAEKLDGQVAAELRTTALPAEVPWLTTPDSPLRLRLGLADRSLRPVDADLTHNNMVVLGPPRSGRSTALVNLARQLIGDDRQVWIAGPPGSPLAGLSGTEQQAFGRVAEITALLEELALATENFPAIERWLIVDDADMFDDRSMYDPIQKALDAGVRIIGSVLGLRGFGSNPLYNELKNARTALFLRPEHAREVQEALSTMPDLRTGLPMPPGRGVLVADRMPTVLQTSSHEVREFSVSIEQPATSPSLLPDPPQTTTPSEETPAPVPHAVDMPPPAPGASAADADSDEWATPPSSDSVPLPGSPTHPLHESSEPRLVLVTDDGAHWPIEATILITRVGKMEPGPGIVALADRFVSARHALIERRGDQVLITDQDSRNGTIIQRGGANPTELQPGVSEVLRPGDEIMAGNEKLRIVNA